ncbi:hypothetical protein LTS10_013076 [Elasticomyces elasticus]|nr:hypothetical protein LTS10_013076 [Elasticomyces elasticus]
MVIFRLWERHNYLNAVQLFDEIYQTKLSVHSPEDARLTVFNAYATETRETQIRKGSEISTAVIIEGALEHILRRGLRWKALLHVVGSPKVLLLDQDALVHGIPNNVRPYLVIEIKRRFEDVFPPTESGDNEVTGTLVEHAWPNRAILDIFGIMVKFTNGPPPDDFGSNQAQFADAMAQEPYPSPPATTMTPPSTYAHLSPGANLDMISLWNLYLHKCLTSSMVERGLDSNGRRLTARLCRAQSTMATWQASGRYMRDDEVSRSSTRIASPRLACLYSTTHYRRI